MLAIRNALLIFFFTLMAWSAVGIVKARLALRTSPKSHERAIEYCMTWDIMFVGLSCVQVACLLGPSVGSSLLALATVVLMNVIVQPLHILVLYLCIGNLRVALRGRIAYAGKAVPEADLEKYSREERRALFRHRVLSSTFGLLLFGGLSAACIWPLFQLVFEPPTPNQGEIAK